MRVQQDHWTVLLDFCEEHPQIITNRFNGPNGKEDFCKLWKQLCLLLNSLGHGEKTEVEWKKALIDWKSKTKAKAGTMRSQKVKTGGGESIPLVLTNNEERLLKLMGKTAVEGDNNVPEVGVPKRKREEMQEGASGNGVLVHIQGAKGTLKIPKLAIPLSKMVPVTIEKEEVPQALNPPTPTTDMATNGTPRKKQTLNKFIETNDELLLTLRSIDKNIASINSNFEKLVNILEQKINK